MIKICKAAQRYSLEISCETAELLDRLAATDNSTQSRVLSKALALYETAVNAISEGKRLAITGEQFELVGEIVGVISPQDQSNSRPR